MDSNLAAGTRAVEEEYVEEKQAEAEKKDMADASGGNEKRRSAGLSSESGSEPDLRKYDSKIVKIRDVPVGDAALAHLPEHEREVLKRQIDTPNISVGWFSLYRYATTWDLVIVVISTLCAIGGGAVMPLMTVGRFQ